MLTRIKPLLIAGGALMIAALIVIYTFITPTSLEGHTPNATSATDTSPQNTSTAVGQPQAELPTPPNVKQANHSNPLTQKTKAETSAAHFNEVLKSIDLEKAKTEKTYLNSLTPEQQTAYIHMKTQETIQEFENTVSTEEKDPDWSLQAQSQLEQMLQKEELKGFSLTSAECKSSMCRLEVRADPNAPAENTLRYLNLSLPWSGQSFSQIKNDGTTIMYLAREGHQLPGGPQTQPN